MSDCCFGVSPVSYPDPDPWQPNVKFSKKYSKIFFPEVIRGMKLKLHINVFVIMLYINHVFYCCCACGFIAMATLSFHRFIMGKVKVGLYFYFDKSFAVMFLE